MPRFSRSDRHGFAALAPFTACTRAEVARIGSLSAGVDLAEGTILVRQGSVARQCFLIEHGSVLVVRDHDAAGLAGPGEFMGEMGLLHGVARCASAVTLSSVRARVFSAGEFFAMRQCVPAVAEAMDAVAGERRRVIHQLADRGGRPGRADGARRPPGAG